MTDWRRNVQAIDVTEISVEPAAGEVEASPTICFDIVRNRGAWRILHIGKHSRAYGSKEAAINAAMKSAEKRKITACTVVVRLNRTDGTVLVLTDEIELTVSTASA